MNWLTKLPVIGPALAWFFRTRAWRTYQHLNKRKWTRLAAAITFTSFISLFPLLALAAAAGAALLSTSQMNTVQHAITEQVPGISDKLNLHDLAANAGTVGLVAAVSLLLTGVSWAGSLRESLRSLWDIEEDPGNPIKLKLKDLGTLIGLGVVGLVSLAGAGFAVAVVGWLARQIGIAEAGAGVVLLRVAGYAVAVAADVLLLWYVLTVLPGVRPPRRAVLGAALMGAVGFEVLKLALGSYLQGVAAKSMYGTFGVPIALLLWISFMAKLMLFCASWTVTQPTGKPIEAIDALGSGAPDPGGSERAAPGPADDDAAGEEGASREEDASREGNASGPADSGPADSNGTGGRPRRDGGADGG